MHPNSLLAYEQEAGAFSNREKEIIQAVSNFTNPITDRDIRDMLGYSEMNFVRPRITELIQSGMLEEAGDTIDKVTGKRVRLVRIKEAQGRLAI